MTHPAPPLMDLDPTHAPAEPMPANGSPSFAPRVTVTDIRAQIDKVRYFVDGRLTVCVITLKNGFKQPGFSACVSDESFNQALGEKYAFENAFEQLWNLMGFVFCQRLYEDSIAEAK